MKTLVFFLLASTLCFFKANSAPGPVLDSFGKNLRTGIEYRVIALDKHGFSCSILPKAVGNNKSCPAGVVEYEGGTLTHPLTVTPVNHKKGVISLSTDVNIKFSGSNVCHESNVWKLKYDKAMKQYVVMLGGVEGNPGPETLDNWFKIESVTTGGYKFVFCPSVCSYCKVMCMDIGTTVDENHNTRLVLGGDPMTFFFYSKFY